MVSDVDLNFDADRLMFSMMEPMPDGRFGRLRRRKVSAR